MRLTKENIHKYLNGNKYLYLSGNQEITHIDYIHDNIKYIRINHSNIEEITCELPEGLETFYCNYSKLKSLPLLPKTLEYYDGEDSNLPKEFKVMIYNNNTQCNNLRKIQLLELI